MLVWVAFGKLPVAVVTVILAFFGGRWWRMTSIWRERTQMYACRWREFTLGSYSCAAGKRSPWGWEIPDNVHKTIKPPGCNTMKSLVLASMTCCPTLDKCLDQSTSLKWRNRIDIR